MDIVGTTLDHRRALDQNLVLENGSNLCPLGSEHLPAILNWFTTSAEITRWGGPDFYFPITLADFERLLLAHKAHSYVLTDASGELAGFAQVNLRKYTANNQVNEYLHLARIAIAPCKRGGGLAKPLLQAVMQRAEIIYGQREASLFVYSNNTVAIQCYLSLGFVRRSLPQEASANFSDCLFMVRPASAAIPG